MAAIRAITNRQIVPLHTDWQLVPTAAGAAESPSALPPSMSWIPAPVPGTVAQALRDAGLWRLDAPTPLQDRDYWYRLRFSADGHQILRFQGLATLAEVWLNGERLLVTDNMFLAHQIEVSLPGENILHLCFRALLPALAARKGRARWRPRMVTPPTLRGIRTTLLGHMPGWCPPVHAIGPWRPVERLVDDPVLRVQAADVRVSVDQGIGRVSLLLQLDRPAATCWPVRLLAGDHVAEMRWAAEDRIEGTLEIENPDLWWPHTHGTPRRYPLELQIGAMAIDLGPIGFRTVERDTGSDGSGFALRINGEKVFCRGACWSNADIVSLPGDARAYAPWLELTRDAGMNMVRVGGTMVYESDAFFGLCDSLGILVWQDFMFANFDYPIQDPSFRENVMREATQLLDRVQTSPALVVLCGGSEVAQQAAMLGLPRAAWGGALFDEILRTAVEAARPDVVYVPNSPSGGDLPFSADNGVTHYYGVGAYCRPLDDARRANVRFASECLGFANVPESVSLARGFDSTIMPVHHPLWKARVPRDAGAPWDFEDIRDHYLAQLYEVEPSRLRYEDSDRYLRLSRAVSADVIEAVIGEWRREGSTCSGALVWFLQDLQYGAGWGLVDSLGQPKAAWHGMRRAAAPLQLVISDEGVNGLALHLINEHASEVSGTLSLTCLRHGAVRVIDAHKAVTVPPRQTVTFAAASLMGSFFDINYAYRFGPLTHDVTRAAFHDEADVMRAEAFHFPVGRNLSRGDIGLTATARKSDAGWCLAVQTERFAQSVHIEDEGFRAVEEWFHLVPGIEKIVPLLPRDDRAGVPDGEIHALNAWSPTPFKGTR